MRIVGTDDAGIGVLARELQAGRLVVAPTPRWYMVCATAANVDACALIFQAKARPTSKSLVLLVPDTTYLESHFVIDEPLLFACASLGSGHLAMRLRWKSHPPERTSSVGDPVALVSVPDGVLGELVKATGTPLAATSVNVSGDGLASDPGPAVSVDEVVDIVSRTGMPVAALCDGGVSPLFNHMTILDGTGTRLRIERQGLVHTKALKAVGIDLHE